MVYSLLLALFGSLWWHQPARPSALLNFGDTLAQAAHHTVAHSDTLGASLAWGTLRNTLTHAQDAPSEVRAFYHDIFVQHGLNPANIVIKINPEEFSSAGIQAFGSTTIILAKHYLSNLQAALANPQEPESQKILDAARTIMKHEIKHLKNKDTTKRLAANFAASAVTHAGFALLTPHALTQNPTSFIGLAVKSIFLWFTGKLKLLAHRKLVDTYEAYQEKTADDYAFAHSSTEDLKQTIKTFQASQQAIVNILAGTQEANPAFHEDTLKAIANQKQALKQRYVQSGSTEPYPAWVSTQTEDLERAERTFFPGRPLLKTTIQDALTAARRQNIQASAANCCQGHANQ